MTKKHARPIYLLLGALVILALAAGGCLRPVQVPPYDPPFQEAPPVLPDIPISEEPEDRYISSTIGETMTFSITTEEAVTVTWRLEQVPPPTTPRVYGVCPIRVWEIGEDVDVTFSEVRIEPPEVGYFRVIAEAVIILEEEVPGFRCWRKVGWGVWYWEVVEEAP
ncbi:hypothetical protein M1O19_02830 [Dehalococcoidia bacterium]|nr:hypothetical protein [Dehalococcoidia bacterium]MCL0080603.1 hypothetical protein [Dehalococcoidia bacterium]MCL0089244.1 hypothetical protein [Dehalococcoidia bacterium]MCL0097447.1 hypothetical protein [Dehalococcoidia bacterium]